jgi:hypothetical protein
MKNEKFKISKLDRACMVTERVAAGGIKIGSIGIIICGVILLSAASVRQFNHHKKN